MRPDRSTGRRRLPPVRALARATVAAALLTAAVPAPPAAAADDPLVASQWGLAKVGAASAWAASTGRGIRIGVVDTGVDLAHEDLAARVVASASCVGASGNAARCTGSGQDDHGHGTHVSGIAAAVRGNGKGINGVAPDAQLVVAKVLESDGTGRSSDVVAGIRWVVDQGARVVNLSLGDEAILGLIGTPDGGASMADALRYAWSKGAIPVLASGNNNEALFGGSANYGNLDAVVVGATDRNDRVARYSSPIGNAKWGIVAPGGAADGNVANDIVSTYWFAGRSNSYATNAGTSMAAPHVSGALALLLAQGLGRDAAVARLLDTADRAVSCGSTCRGRLDVAKAVGAAPAPTTTTVAPPAPGERPAAPGSQRPPQPRTSATTGTVPLPSVPELTPATPVPVDARDADEADRSLDDAPDEVAAPVPADGDDPRPLGAAAAVLLAAAAAATAVVSRRRRALGLIEPW